MLKAERGVARRDANFGGWGTLLPCPQAVWTWVAIISSDGCAGVRCFGLGNVVALVPDSIPPDWFG